MADIIINEISQNYSYVIGDESFATVALPITAQWGPGYFEPATMGISGDGRAEKKVTELEDVVWQRFSANQAGIEAFVSMYRGPANNYRLAKDYSYQMAMTLLSAGYDVLVCRLNPGTYAQGIVLRDTSKDTSISKESVSFADGVATLANPAIAEGTVVLKVTDSTNTTTTYVDNRKGQFLKGSSVLSGVAINYDTGKITVDSTPDVVADELISCEITSNTVEVIVLEPVDGAEYEYSNDNGANWQASSKFTGLLADENYGILVRIKDAEDVFDSIIVRTQVESIAEGTVVANYDHAYEYSGKFILSAKYVGSFGNRLLCTLKKMRNRNCWNLIVYIIDSTGVKYSVENKTFTFEIENSSDSVLHLEEIESDYINIEVEGVIKDGATFTEDANNISFSGGADRPSDTAINFASDASYSITPILDENGEQEADGETGRDKYRALMEDETVFLRTGVVQLGHKDVVPGTVQYMVNGNVYADVPSSPSGGGEISQGTIAVKVDDTHTHTVTINYKAGTISSSDRKGQKDSITYNYGDVVYREDLLLDDAITYAKRRYDIVMHVNNASYNSCTLEQKDEILDNALYITALNNLKNYGAPDLAVASTRRYQEWLYTEVQDVYDLLLDRLSYAPNRVISPGWDDQDILELTPDAELTRFEEMSPLHYRLMYVAYYARCTTAYIDVPKSLKRKYVYNGSLESNEFGYVQMLARYEPTSEDLSIDGTLYPTHSALFGPWGTYKYVGTNKYCPANPGFLALIIQKSMLKNQAVQYEWIQPSNRQCSVNIGKMAYTVPQKTLDLWQPEPDQDGGCGVNAIGDIPSVGLSIWGDSTLYENPPAVYQALRNLSTRLLVNALKNQAYKVGLSITWNYNNETAYSKFHVGMTPLCDAMRNAGAIEDYYIRMQADLDKIGQVKANSCIGKIYLVPVGTIQRITVDLIALPPGTDLAAYTAQ